ncbi:MAG: DUF262 domain-containing protein [Bacteroidetes bacterium]|nr:DUF262 domain-containing protein [Bacteroidota bacterium]
MKTFSIEANSFVIKSSKGKKYKSLLEDGITYHIPIFQRTYAWTGKEIAKLLADLFLSFWDLDGKDEPEPMFIGTMQLSELKDEQGKKSFYDVVDGQQRLTTLLILLKYFNLMHPGCLEPYGITLDWLRTSVSNGIQQKQLEEMLNVATLEDIDQNHINPFIRNLSRTFP